jgi:hypothetical protein
VIFMRRQAALLALSLLGLSGCAGASGEVAVQYQPAVPRYIVLYAPSASGLDVQAQSLVSEAARVVGYSSTAGMDEADQQLAELRATTVMNQLVADGVPVSQVTSMARGATTYQFSPKDAQRVEIDIVHAGF